MIREYIDKLTGYDTVRGTNICDKLAIHYMFKTKGGQSELKSEEGVIESEEGVIAANRVNDVIRNLSISCIREVMRKVNEQNR